MNDSKGGNLESKSVIDSTEQLIQEFGDVFDKMPTSNISENIYVEKVGKNKENDEEERFFATEDILGTVIAYDSNVWDLDLTNEKLINKITEALIAIKTTIEDSEDIDKFDTNIEFNGKLINVTYEPYSESSDYIVRELSERGELLQN